MDAFANFPPDVIFRSRWLTREAGEARLASRALKRTSRMLRARTAAAVREFATMRLARMARGASDGYVLKETREYRCPSCQAEVISPAGSVSAMDGLIKSLHRCEVCQLTFFVVRAAIELTMKRETPDSSNP